MNDRFTSDSLEDIRLPPQPADTENTDEPSGSLHGFLGVPFSVLEDVASTRWSHLVKWHRDESLLNTLQRQWRNGHPKSCQCHSCLDLRSSVLEVGMWADVQ